MAALIFRRGSNAQSALPYAKWLKDFQEPIVLFTVGQEPGDEFFAHVERFDSFDTDGLAEIRALELSKHFRYTQIFAQSEHDILRAAQLRGWFGLSGQSIDSARAFRDKVYMKTLARAGAVDVPAFRAVDSPIDVCRFIQKHGYPCVVKPRTGAGSRGVRVLRSPEDLKHFLRLPFSANQLIEVFIDGPLFHVDGFVSSGQVLFISTSKYVNTCLAHQTGQSYGSAVLHPRSGLAGRLVSKTKLLLASLPLADHLAFHAEFFVDKYDRIVLCEVASRPGGSGIVDMVELASGVNLYEQWIKRVFGLPVELPLAQPWSAAGRLWIPPQRGRLLSLPAAIPFRWVIEYRPNSVAGQCWGDPLFCTANIASFTLSGRDTDQVESRIRLLDKWFRSHVEWKDDPIPFVSAA